MLTRTIDSYLVADISSRWRLKVETRGILWVSDNGAEPAESSIFAARQGSF